MSSRKPSGYVYIATLESHLKYIIMLCNKRVSCLKGPLKCIYMYIQFLLICRSSYELLRYFIRNIYKISHKHYVPTEELAARLEQKGVIKQDSYNGVVPHK